MTLLLLSNLFAYPAWLEDPYHDVAVQETLVCTLAQQNLSEPTGIVYASGDSRAAAIVAEAQSVRLTLEYLHGQIDLQHDATRLLSYLGQGLGYMQRDFWLHSGENPKSFIRACFHKDSPLAQAPARRMDVAISEGPAPSGCSSVQYDFYPHLQSDLSVYPTEYIQPLLLGIESRAMQDALIYAYLQHAQQQPPSMYTLRDLSNYVRTLHANSTPHLYYNVERKGNIPIRLSVSLCLK